MRFLVIAGLMASSLWAQTRVDLKSQSKNIDFSSAGSARPFPTGTTLPATCTVGAMFFKSDASAGSNLFGCATANTWAVEAGGIGGNGPSTLFDLPLSIQKNGNLLTIGQSCSITSPCLVRVGSVVYSILASATVAVQSGDGLVFFYIDRSGVLSAGTNTSTSPAISCTGCQTMAPIIQFPVDSIPLGTWTATGGAWDPTGTDSRAILSAAPNFAAGPNVSISQTAGQVTIAATLSTIASGTLPTCGSTTQGTIWYTPGGAGMKDAVQICAKDSSDTYAWRTIY